MVSSGLTGASAGGALLELADTPRDLVLVIPGAVALAAVGVLLAYVKRKERK